MPQELLSWAADKGDGRLLLLRFLEPLCALRVLWAWEDVPEACGLEREAESGRRDTVG